MSDALYKEISKRCWITGEFTLRSGKTSDKYFDKYQFESDPDLLKAVASEISTRLAPGASRLAGLEMGGIPVATAVSLHTGLPLLFVRKKAKEYGTMRQIEGEYEPGDQVIVIEDVTTTGGAIVDAISALRDQGLRPIQVICVLCRSPKASERIEELGIPFFPVYSVQVEPK